jgi:hypothetical protein
MNRSRAFGLTLLALAASGSPALGAISFNYLATPVEIGPSAASTWDIGAHEGVPGTAPLPPKIVSWQEVEP